MLQIFAFFQFFDFCLAACNFCSTFNIENHYGSFFDNPREVQNGYAKYVDCSRQKFHVQKCDGMCFSLNVSTSLDAESDFGISYGCATGLLPEDLDFSAATGCASRRILLRTSPPYRIHATYCQCASNQCNRIVRHAAKPAQKAAEAPRFRVKNGGAKKIVVVMLMMMMMINLVL